MEGQSPAQLNALQAVYDGINRRTAKYPDFAEEHLEQSRQYFDLSTPELRTREFDVLTCLVGLEVPRALQGALSTQLAEILRILPRAARVYCVKPPLMHWEVHIIRRPGEREPEATRDAIADLMDQALSGLQAFQLTFRGWFVAPDGTIGFTGYGDISALRSRLRAALPFSSPRQNETAHISVARILDPIGPKAFDKLMGFQRATEDTTLGVLNVDEVKLVAEQRWYMEDHDVLHVARLAGRDAQ